MTLYDQAMTTSPGGRELFALLRAATITRWTLSGRIAAANERADMARLFPTRSISA